MNKIEKLIQELCPNGVEWKKVKDLCVRNKGINVTAAQMSKMNTVGGTIRIFAAGSTIADVTEKEIPSNKVIRDPSVIVKSRGNIDFAFYERPFTHKSEMWSYSAKEGCNIKYLYYFLSSKSVEFHEKAKTNSVKLPQLCVSDTDDYPIPLPPLPVQTEIVRILDKFVEQQEQLEKLIELRKKQYEYYREEMLTAKEGKEWTSTTLGEIGTFVRGNGLLKSDFTEEGCPCIHYGQVHTYFGFSTTETKSFCSEALYRKLKKASYGDLIIATTSEDVDACCKATIWLGDGEVGISGDSYLFHHNQDPKYIGHLFKTKSFAEQKRMVATGAKVVRVSGESMAKFEFSFPSKDKQKQIADALDNFESSISALTSALELSKKRYEHYRDEMLRF